MVWLNIFSSLLGGLLKRAPLFFAFGYGKQKQKAKHMEDEIEHLQDKNNRLLSRPRNTSDRLRKLRALRRKARD